MYSRCKFSDNQRATATKIDVAADALEKLISELYGSREKQMAVEKIDECRMWAKAAIAAESLVGSEREDGVE